MKHFPKELLDEICAGIDLPGLIGKSVELKANGPEFKACCPFHDEKTPSFSVVPKKGFYHCHGCGAHGNAVTWMVEHEGMPFVDAVKHLAEEANVSLSDDVVATRTSNDQAAGYAVLDGARAVYSALLRKSQDAIEFARKRGITGETAKAFQIGYAPDAWDTIRGNADLDSTIAEKYGLLTASRRSTGKVFDTFRNRLVFPIRDTSGRTISFGGRRMNDADEKAPKYLNGGESPVFTKGRTLFGLYEALKASRNLDTGYVVEGYMDVVSLYQAGFFGGVSGLGTAFTPKQAEIAFRHFRKLVFCFDGDKAGKAAAWKAMEVLVPQMRNGREVHFVFMTEGEDPDSVIRDGGKGAFQALLDQAVPMSQFIVDALKAKYGVETAEAKGAMLDHVAKYIRAMEPCGLRQVLITSAADAAGTTREAVVDLVDDKPSASDEADLEADTPLRRAMRILIEYPHLAKTVTHLEVYQTIDMKGVKLLVSVIEAFQKMEHPSVGALMNRWSGHVAGKALARVNELNLPVAKDEAEAAFNDAMNGIMDWARSRAIASIVQRSGEGALSEAEVNKLSSYIARLESRLAIS